MEWRICSFQDLRQAQAKSADFGATKSALFVRQNLAILPAPEASPLSEVLGAETLSWKNRFAIQCRFENGARTFWRMTR
jgi:hypothetical protein